MAPLIHIGVFSPYPLEWQYASVVWAQRCPRKRSGEGGETGAAAQPLVWWQLALALKRWRSSLCGCFPTCWWPGRRFAKATVAQRVAAGATVEPWSAAASSRVTQTSRRGEKEAEKEEVAITTMK
jgi:hypothetical protein